MDSQGKSGRAWVVAVACLLMTFCTAFLSTGLGIVLAGIRETYGISGTESSMILTIRSVVSFVVTMFSGVYFGKLGLRKGVTVSLLIGAATFIVFWAANGSVPVYYVGGAMAGVTYAYSLMLPASMIVKRWFNKDRGLALSIAAGGTSVTQLLGAPVVQWIMNNLGMVPSFFFQAGLLAVIAILLFIIIRDNPEELGLEPVGGKDWVDPQLAGGKKDAKAAAPADKPGLGFVWVLLIALGVVFIGIAGSPAVAHIPLAFRESLDSMIIATGISLFGGVKFVATIVYGKISDTIGSRLTSTIFGFIVSAGIAMCAIVSQAGSVPLMFACFVIMGIGYPCLTQGYPTWAADLFKTEDYDKTLRYFQLAYQAGAMIGSPIPGIIADATGTYAPSYILFGAGYAASVVITMIAYRVYAAKLKKTQAEAPVAAVASAD